jgi:hypothetical protein
MMLEPDIDRAAISGRSIRPNAGTKTPAAMGSARVKNRIVATHPRRAVDLLELPRGERAAAVGQPARFGDAVGGTGLVVDLTATDRPVEDRPGHGHDVLAGVSTRAVRTPRVCAVAAATSFMPSMSLRAVRRGAVAPEGGHPGPVGAVGAVRTRASGSDHDRQVLTERRRPDALLRVLEVGDGRTERHQRPMSRASARRCRPYITELMRNLDAVSGSKPTRHIPHVPRTATRRNRPSSSERGKPAQSGCAR